MCLQGEGSSMEMSFSTQEGEIGDVSACWWEIEVEREITLSIPLSVSHLSISQYSVPLWPFSNFFCLLFSLLLHLSLFFNLWAISSLLLTCCIVLFFYGTLLSPQSFFHLSLFLSLYVPTGWTDLFQSHIQSVMASGRASAASVEALVIKERHRKRERV